MSNTENERDFLREVPSFKITLKSNLVWGTVNIIMTKARATRLQIIHIYSVKYKKWRFIIITAL